MEGKSLDVTSSLVAGTIGAALLAIFAYFSDDIPVATAALVGFVVGIGIQSGVRLTGVS